MTEDEALDAIFDLLIEADLSAFGWASLGFAVMALGLSKLPPENRDFVVDTLGPRLDDTLEKYAALKAKPKSNGHGGLVA